MSAGEDRSDEQLLQWLAEDDPAAFDVLFERHADFVHNLAFRRTASWASAEDVTAIVFLELWHQRRRLVTQAGSLRPGLVAVAINQVKRGWAGQARQRSLADRLPRPVADHDHADDVAARLDDEDRMRRLNAALATLPAFYVDVLTLWAWEGLSYEEIGAALGLPVGTVRSRLHRARARLRAASGTAEAAPSGTAGAAPAYLVESPAPATDVTPSGGEGGGRA
jgi:RNA polymerase sigma-70 factor (ECF subfamily)